jgi:hypothetical protein
MLVLMLTLMLDAGFDYDSKNFKSRFSQCSKFRQNDHEQEPEYEHEGKTRTGNIEN